jgi:hypothetical protein
LYDDHVWIRYFDNEDASKDVKIIFDKKNKRGYVSFRNKRVKKYEMPFVADYLKKKLIKYDEYMANYFDAFCSPQTEEFILSIFSKYFVDTTDDDILEILSNDKPFIEALKEVKDSFDTKYRRITSYPNFVF